MPAHSHKCQAEILPGCTALSGGTEKDKGIQGSHLPSCLAGEMETRHLVTPCSVALVDFPPVLKVVRSFRLKGIHASDPVSLFLLLKKIWYG